MPIEGYVEIEFVDGAIGRQVFRRGQGPGVIIMHELPGLTPEVIRFANWVADAGFTVFVPCFFGRVGADISTVGNFKDMALACIRREFRLLAKHESSPLTTWVRALCRSVYDELGGRGVGAIGMCLTGNFALALMVDEHVMAPVLCQPSLPLSVSAAHRQALHISDETLDIVKRRTAAGAKVLGLRFSGDRLCPPERFARLRHELGDGFEGIEIDSSPGNEHGLGRRAHSVLTIDLVDEAGHPTIVARDRVLAFFRDRLQTPSS